MKQTKRLQCDEAKSWMNNTFWESTLQIHATTKCTFTEFTYSAQNFTCPLCCCHYKVRSRSSFDDICMTESPSPSLWGPPRACIGSGRATSACGEAHSIGHLSRTHNTSAGTWSGYGSLRGTVSPDGLPPPAGHIADLSVGRKTAKARAKIWISLKLSQDRRASWNKSAIYLQFGVVLFARADFADPSLFHQLALAVSVGRPGGNSSAAGFGAGGPSRGLRHTLDPSDEIIGFTPPRGGQLIPVGEVVSRQFVSARRFSVFRLGGALCLCELFTAPAPYLDPLGLGTAQFGQPELMRAEGDTSNSTVHASALVFAVWTEDFPVLVNAVAVLARSSVCLGCFRETEELARFGMWRVNRQSEWTTW